MLSGQVIELYAGSAEDVLIPLADDEASPIDDLSGWTGRLQVRYSPDHPDVLAEWSTAAGSMVLADSRARLVVDAARAGAAMGWTWRLARWDLVLTAPAGQGSRPNRPIRGLFRVVQGITR